jgi:2-oxoisovalerate dehydrogenase E1 component
VRDAVRRPKLRSAEEVTAPLAPRRPEAVARRAATPALDEERRRVHGATLPEDEGPLTLAQTINAALTDALLAEPGAHLHLYGKGEARPGRKMGHVTRLGSDPVES